MAKIVNKCPVGIQDFATIREEGYIYVDKTGYIVDLFVLRFQDVL